MKKYIVPEVEVVNFTAENIMTTSNPGGTPVPEVTLNTETASFKFPTTGGKITYGEDFK